MNSSNKIKILIVGAGMFVTGRGSNNMGTILPAVCSAYSNNLISEIIVASTSADSSGYAKKCVSKLNKIFNKKIKIKNYPSKGKNINAYLDVAKNLKPDAAIISVPDNLHFEICKNLIKLKIHCLVVKPLCDNLKEAKHLIRLTNQYKVLGLVEFHKRFDEANILIKENILKGKIGELLYSVIEYSQKKTIPEKIFKNWHEKTNVFQYLGVHYVDLIYHFTNFKPVSVLAIEQNEYLSSKKIKNSDTIQVIIEWLKPNKKKFTSYHFSSWIDPNSSSSMSDQKISLIGSKGKIVSDQKNRGLQIVNDNDGIEDINPYFSSLVYDKSYANSNFFGYGFKSIFSFVENVIDVNLNVTNFKKIIKNNRSFEDSLTSTAIIEAANKSLKLNKKIKIKI
jgi:D-galacturonate reductase